MQTLCLVLVFPRGLALCLLEALMGVTQLHNSAKCSCQKATFLKGRGMLKSLFVMLSFVWGAHAVHAAEWSYSETEDKMSGDMTKLASVRSDNSLSLDFPYKGVNHGTLAVRQRGRELVVMFQIDKGQILCSAYSSCEVRVRFDDDKPMVFTGAPAKSGDSNVVFINNEAGFVRAATKAKRIFVQPTIYQNGSPVLEFSFAEALKWQLPAAKAKR